VIGGPEKNLRYVSKNARNGSDTLKDRGIKVSSETVRTTLRRLGYRMQGNRKVKSSGADHPDRAAQFLYIERQTKKAIKGKNPVISVDTKKKEVLGALKMGKKNGTGRGKALRWWIMILFPLIRPIPIRMAYTI
jgi:hypothetical protein